MNRYKVYFKDGSTIEVKAVTLFDAEFQVLLKTCRPVQDIERIIML